MTSLPNSPLRMVYIENALSINKTTTKIFMLLLMVVIERAYLNTFKPWFSTGQDFHCLQFHIHSSKHTLNRWYGDSLKNLCTSKMADRDQSWVINYPYQRDFGGEKKNSVRSLFWREIQIQKWPILYVADFDTAISSSQEPPPPRLIWWKIPAKGLTKFRKKNFEKIEKISRNSNFSKKNTSL